MVCGWVLPSDFLCHRSTWETLKMLLTAYSTNSSEFGSESSCDIQHPLQPGCNPLSQLLPSPQTLCSCNLFLKPVMFWSSTHLQEPFSFPRMLPPPPQNAQCFLQSPALRSASRVPLLSMIFSPHVCMAGSSSRIWALCLTFLEILMSRGEQVYANGLRRNRGHWTEATVFFLGWRKFLVFKQTWIHYKAKCKMCMKF